MSKKSAKKKVRMSPSAQPGVTSVPVTGSPANDGSMPARRPGARLAGKSATNLAFDNQPSYSDPGGLETDANLSRIEQRAREAYQQPDQMGITRGPLPGPAEGRLPTDQNLDRINARGESKAGPAQITALDAALSSLDRAAQKVRNGNEAGKFAKLERLQKARAAVVTARDAVLARSDAGSAGNDADMRARASSESAAPGISRAASMISKLQRR